VVVSVAAPTGGGSRAAARSFSRATVLLAGIASLPTPSGNVPSLPAGHEVRAIEGFARAPQLPAIHPSSNFHFVLPLGGRDQLSSFGFDSGLDGLPQTQAFDPAIAALLNLSASAPSDESSFGRGNTTDSSPTGVERTLGRNQAACEPLAQQLQAGGEYWDAQAIRGRPAQFVGASPADRVQDPRADHSNFSQQGPVGSWCRPLPVAFEDSSPLASRSLWAPILVVLGGILVFWLSRGVRLPC
jgi:hypothetical protein